MFPQQFGLVKHLYLIYQIHLCETRLVSSQSSSQEIGVQVVSVYGTSPLHYDFEALDFECQA